MALFVQVFSPKTVLYDKNMCLSYHGNAPLYVNDLQHLVVKIPRHYNLNVTLVYKTVCDVCDMIGW